eukprot:scaffold1.g5324.t1
MFNRDEVVSRPALPAHFWSDVPGLLGGRDMEGAPRAYRAGSYCARPAQAEARDLVDAPTRGALAVDWVGAAGPAAAAGPLDFLCHICQEPYAGFNLVAGDLFAPGGPQLAYLSNRGGDAAPRLLAPGVHGISNARLDAGWPKVEAGKRYLRALLDRDAFRCAVGGAANITGGSIGGDNEGPASQETQFQQQQEQQQPDAAQGGPSGGSGDCIHAPDPSTGDVGGTARGAAINGAEGLQGVAVPWEQLFGLLSDDRVLERDPARLPNTGYPPEFEALASGVFINRFETLWGDYGTRSQIVLAVGHDGQAELRERYLDEAGAWQEVRHTFCMEPQGRGEQLQRQPGRHEGAAAPPHGG